MIRSYLGLSERWFRRRYIVRVDSGTEGINLGASGRCPFLLDNRRCRIYPVRPLQCRTYPWWPEFARPMAWRTEARRCEGIGQGPEPAPSTVKRRLVLLRHPQPKPLIPAPRKG